MRKYLLIVAAAAAVCLTGCAAFEKVATPENLNRIADAINRKIDDSDDLSDSGKEKLKAEVAEIISKINSAE